MRTRENTVVRTAGREGRREGTELGRCIRLGKERERERYILETRLAGRRIVRRVQICPTQKRMQIRGTTGRGGGLTLYMIKKREEIDATKEGERE